MLGSGDNPDKRQDLSIQDAPVCKQGQKLVYGVSKEESVLVKCDLDADPADVSFHWTFSSSSSGKRMDVTKGVSSSYVHSVINFMPHSDDDYGTLLCWGTNSVGIQRKPCAVTIMPAGPPDSVINCSQVNATEEGMFIECIPGILDGGMSPPVFIGEIYDLETRTLRANLTSSSGSPAFVVRGLPGGTAFRVLVYASNGKGWSAPHILMAHTLIPAEKVTAGVQAMTIIRPVLGVLIGVMVALVIAAVVTVLLLRCRKGKRSKSSEKEQLEDKSLTSLKKDHEETLDTEEKEPDIIPAATVFSGYGVSTEKMMPWTTEAARYSAAVPPKENTESLGSHRTASLKKEPGEVTHAELSFPKSATVLPNPGTGILRMTAPCQSAQTPETPTEYARIDFHRTLRPVPEDHALGLTGEEPEDEGGSACETPLMSNRRESTV